MNTGSQDERQFLANVEAIARNSDRIATALERLNDNVYNLYNAINPSTVSWTP